MNLAKHRVHTRFPSYGGFVVKPTISSGRRGVGRYTATSAVSRVKTIHHAMGLLSQGSGVMTQRCLSQVKAHGEVSVVYFNDVVSHTAQKSAMLHTASDEPRPKEIVTTRHSSQEEWGWGEEVRRYVHDQVKRATKHDTQVLYNRIDLVPGGEDSYYVMEIDLVKGNTYLDSAHEAIEHFTDAIAQRFYW